MQYGFVMKFVAPEATEQRTASNWQILYPTSRFTLSSSDTLLYFTIYFIFFRYLTSLYLLHTR